MHGHGDSCSAWGAWRVGRNCARRGGGHNFESDDDEALADALLVMKSDTEAYQGFRSRCLEGALKYNRRNLALKMLDILKKVNV